MIGMKYLYFQDSKKKNLKQLFQIMFKNPVKFLQDDFLLGLSKIDDAYRIKIVNALDVHVNLDDNVLSLVQRLNALV